MANSEHLAILKQGVEQWNKWTADNPNVRPDLREADLSSRDLRWAHLGGANLSSADLSRANLLLANLQRADLSRANLREANLGGVKLIGANLGEATLVGSDLSKADLTWSNLSGANFAGARAVATKFDDVDLSAVKGLETVFHVFPSTVGIDTVYKSNGNIPEAFLRGCGVPDEMIGFIKSIAGAMQFYSCFISYSTQDQEFADRLYADLQNKGVRCWFAPHDIQGGRKIHEQLDDAIRLHDKLLLILSEHSMTSDWVGTEIANARERETHEKKQMLFPISLAPFEKVKGWKLFDADTGKDSAREIREYFIPDFSHWKDHDIYQKAFERLVKDLKADPHG